MESGQKFQKISLRNIQKQQHGLKKYGIEWMQLKSFESKRNKNKILYFNSNFPAPSQ